MEIYKLMDTANLSLGDRCPKYVVFHRVRKVMLKEFRRKSSALKFMQGNMFTK